jgi:hypothetical protein
VLTLLRVKWFVNISTLAYIGNMPQQQANSGCKTQRANLGCRNCLIANENAMLCSPIPGTCSTKAPPTSPGTMQVCKKRSKRTDTSERSHHPYVSHWRDIIESIRHHSSAASSNYARTTGSPSESLLQFSSGTHSSCHQRSRPLRPHSQQHRYQAARQLSL